ILVEERTRRLMIVDLNTAKAAAARALTRYGIDQDTALFFVKYRENYVFRVDEPGGSYALRLHRNGYRTDAEIQEELDLLTALAAAGAAVPRVRLTIAGEPFCRVVDEDGDVHQIDMLQWVSAALPLGDVADAFSGQAPVDTAAFPAPGGL